MQLEAISEGPFRYDVSRLRGIRLQFSAELLYDYPQELNLTLPIPLPDGLRKVLVGQWLISVRDQEFQHAALFGGEMNNLVYRPTDLMGVQVDGAVLQQNPPGWTGACQTAQNRANPRQQLGQH